MFQPNFRQKEFLVFVLKPNEKLNNYCNLINVLQLEKLLNHTPSKILSPLKLAIAVKVLSGYRLFN